MDNSTKAMKKATAFATPKESDTSSLYHKPIKI